MAVISLPKRLVDVTGVLEGLRGEDSVRSIIISRMESRLGENQSKARKFTKKYGSIKRLRRKILRHPHEWFEETDLFDWEALLTENKKLREILNEARA